MTSGLRWAPASTGLVEVNGSGGYQAGPLSSLKALLRLHSSLFVMNICGCNLQIRNKKRKALCDDLSRGLNNCYPNSQRRAPLQLLSLSPREEFSKTE